MFVHAPRHAGPRLSRVHTASGAQRHGTVQDLGRCGLAYPCPVSRRRLTIGLAVVVGVVVLALIAGTAFVFWSVRRPFPEYDGAVTLPALAGEVEVVRDEHGIPHIYADTAEDLFRAQGYVHAQDRFWQMDFRRHVTAGRLSELFGEDQVETDVFVRTLGWRRVAEQELPLLSPATRRYLEAYAEGVNGWLAGRSGGELGFAYTLLGLTGGDNAPEPWRPVDSLAWLKAMAWDLRGNMEDEIDRALLAAELRSTGSSSFTPRTPMSRTRRSSTTPTSRAGSCPPRWPITTSTRPRHCPRQRPRPCGTRRRRPRRCQISSARDPESAPTRGWWTARGPRVVHPLLVNDPHLGPAMPSIWYQVGLHCRAVNAECPFQVGGFSFSGVPGVVIGHNDRIAWGFTNLSPDVTDLYLEKVDGDTYLVGDEMVPMETREETIEVAGVTRSR